MLCAIFSDSHGDTISLEKAIIKSRAYGEIDYYFYLGDGISDILYMAIKFDLLLNKNVFAVKGNNDFFNSKFNYEHIEIINNKKIFLTHGNRYNVRDSLDILYKKAKTEDIDCVLYGHTHVQNITNIDNIYFVNPGTCYGKTNFALLEIGDNGLIYPVLLS